MTIRIRWRFDEKLHNILWETANRECLLYLSCCKRILDVGCGSSDALKTLRSTNIQVVGIDIKRRYLSKYPLERIVASAYHLPFRRNSFNGAHCRAIVHHLDADRFFKEAKNVCESGCRFAILEPLQGILDFIRRFIKTEVHERGEKPLTNKDLEQLDCFINVESIRFIFGELGYLSPFLLPLSPRAFHGIVRAILEKIVILQEKWPFPPAYTLRLGKIYRNDN